MNFDTGLGSQNSQNSQSSFDLGEYDLLDFDQPPTCSSLSFSLPKATYPSQLILPRKTQSNNDVDSGFDITSSGSRKSQESIQLWETQRAISSQSTVLVTGNTFNLDETETDSQLDEVQRKNHNESQSKNHKQNHERNVSNDSLQIGFEDEEMPLSGVTTTGDEENNEQSQEFSDVPNSVLPEIDPILKLFSKIKSKYSDCAFVYALASNMCKDIYPKNSYISLKTALLLSIVSCNVSFWWTFSFSTHF